MCALSGLHPDFFLFWGGGGGGEGGRVVVLPYRYNICISSLKGHYKKEWYTVVCAMQKAKGFTVFTIMVINIQLYNAHTKRTYMNIFCAHL